MNEQEQDLWNRYVQLVREDPESREITQLAVPLPAGPRALARVVAEVLGRRRPFSSHPVRTEPWKKIIALEDMTPDTDGVFMSAETYHWLGGLASRGSLEPGKCPHPHYYGAGACTECIKPGTPVGVVVPANARGPSIVQAVFPGSPPDLL